MKYFVLSAIASGALLYGMSIIYGMTGTLDLDVIASRVSAGHASLGVIFGLVFIVVAVAFKLGAVPFHMWLPDVYHGAPTSVTLIHQHRPAACVFLARVPPADTRAFRRDGRMEPDARAAGRSDTHRRQRGCDRTEQSEAHARLLNHCERGLHFARLRCRDAAGYSAALYYTLVYILVALGSFGVILLASRHGFEADSLDDYKGLYARDPLLALIMMALMFSTAGVPPFIGFWAKLRIIQELWVTHHGALVVIAAAASVIGAFYYLRIVKLMYFDAPSTEVAKPIRNSGARVALAVNAAAVLALGIVPGPLLELCARILH